MKGKMLVWKSGGRGRATGSVRWQGLSCRLTLEKFFYATKNLLRKLHIGGNHEDQLDVERVIEGRSSHEASVGALIGGQRDPTTGVVTPSSSSGSPTANEFKPSGLSTFLNAVKDSVGRVGQSPSNSNEKSSNPITNAFGQLRPRLDASKGNSGGTGELDSATIATRRGGLSSPGSFKRGGPSPPGSIHRLANENQKAEPPLDPTQIDEDYQVQMAMALSVAGNYQPTTPARVETAQIEAAKRISLGLSPAAENSPSDTMSYRYWASVSPSTIATRRGGLPPPGSFKRGGPSPPGSIHRLANEDQKAEPSLEPVQIDEDYQEQMAMALSVASNYQPTTPARVETAQIEAAKRISLGLSTAAENSPSEAAERISLGLSSAAENSPSHTMSYRYWAYNVVDYEEVIPDGFYDLFGIRSDSRLSERMPILAELQKMPVSETSKEVVLVDRQLDPDLVSLQEKAAEVVESAKAKDESSLRTYVAQKIALILVENMGGPVGSETDMLFRWKKIKLGCEE